MPGTRDRRTRHRSAPRRSLRYSIALPLVAPALCLTGVWGYTAVGLVDEQAQLSADADNVAFIGQPAHDVVTRLQDERRLTAAWQAAPNSSSRAALDKARTRTDAAVEDFRRTSGGHDTDQLKNRAEKLTEALDALSDRRDAIDARSLHGASAFQYFTDTIADSMSLLATATRTDDGSLAHHAAAAMSLVQLTEKLSREDALISGSLPTGRMAAAARTQFGQYVAIQQEARTGLDTAALPAGEATAYESLTGSSSWTTIASVEDAVVSTRDAQLPDQAKQWPDAADRVVGKLQNLGSDSLGNLNETAEDRADDLLLGVILGTVAALTALGIGGALTMRFRRSMLQRLSRIQQQTENMAAVGLPKVLAQLQRGERAEPVAPRPDGRQATDEIDRLHAAIEKLGRVAADTVVQQSLGREGTEKVFAQLSRRTQILIHRLISLLDDLERKHEDSDLLKDIFKVDHLATRVRRHSENLVILGGSPPTRRLTAPVSITDVMRSAVAETEQYTRVKVKNLPPDRRVSLAGRTVADVTHLLAELIENGTSFSPPETQVFVSATKVAKGLAVHIEDHGLGMPEDHRFRANHLLAHPPKLDVLSLGDDPRLGHFVVARLAKRHKIKVELRESVYGGTLAIVFLPSELLEEHKSPLLDQLTSAASAASAANAAAINAPVGSAAVGIAEATSQVQLVDHHGYPEYGGAGLLPSSSHPAAQPPAAAPAEWPHAQEHPGHQARQPAPAADDHTQPASRPPTHHAPPPWDGGSSPQRLPNSSPLPTREAAPPLVEDASQPLATPQVLPQRTPGVNLAQQLRREAAYVPVKKDQGDEGEIGGLSPAESARTMIAIQRGLKRARISEADESAGVDGQADPHDRAAN